MHHSLLPDNAMDSPDGVGLTSVFDRVDDGILNTIEGRSGRVVLSSHNPIGSLGSSQRNYSNCSGRCMTCYIATIDPKNEDNEVRIAINTHFRDDESLRKSVTYTIVRMRRKSLRYAIAWSAESIKQFTSTRKIHSWLSYIYTFFSLKSVFSQTLSFLK